MAFRFSMDSMSGSSPNESRRSSGSSGRYEESCGGPPEQRRVVQTAQWSPQGNSAIYDQTTAIRSPFCYYPPRNVDPWARHARNGSHEYPTSSSAHLNDVQSRVTVPRQGAAGAMPNSRNSFSNRTTPMPGPMLRRTSSEEVPLSEMHQAYSGFDMSSSVPDLQTKAFAQRRPSNRDEFDGPAQFLHKPVNTPFEPREDELPALPVSLYAQEQDDILSLVNDRLSKCAFDFIAKYQFPIPIEADKRPVRVANDREWQEWVYLLKRLATKRRIPARVLYNGQIKQLITILENSIEMRHAAKHQSRPLKDDRNILQLISSGLQVAKILKDAPAMQVLDDLYTQTERKIQERRAFAASATVGVTRA